MNDEVKESGLFDEPQPGNGPWRGIRRGYAQKLASTSYATLYMLYTDGKRYLMKGGNGEDFSLDMLRREFELGVQTQHPNIAQVYAFEEQLPCVAAGGIVMEWVDGRDLVAFMAKNPPLKTRLRVVDQLLDAVDYLHRRGIVHNDLKGSNIMVTNSGDSVKLIDFGLSDDDAHLAVRTPGCTPAYAAPELLEDRKSDARSDLYSLGHLLRLLLPEGRYKGVAQRCLQREPADRYQSIDELRHAVDSRRNTPLLAVAVAIILAVVAAAAALMAWQHGAENKVEPHPVEVALSTEPQNSVDPVPSGSDSPEEFEAEAAPREPEVATEREAVLAAIDRDVSRAYALAMDSIEAARFSNFATPIIIHYYQYIQCLNERLIAEMAGKPYASEARAYLEKKATAMAIPFESVKLPSLSDASNELTEEELEFYATLLLEGKPYEPMAK